MKIEINAVDMGVELIFDTGHTTCSKLFCDSQEKLHAALYLVAEKFWEIEFSEPISEEEGAL